MKDKRKLNWLIVAYLLFVFLVLTAAINPGVRLNKIKLLGIRSDYILHCMLFIPWMVLAFRRWARSAGDIAAFSLSAGAGVFLAGISEAIQYFIPNRSLSTIDFAADSLGIFVGAMLSGWGRGVKIGACIQKLGDGIKQRQSQI
jgi:VanZ family protein